MVADIKLVMDYTKMLNELLQVAVKNKASDVHLKADSRPFLRMKGKLVPCGAALPAKVVRGLIFSMMEVEQTDYLLKYKEIDFAYRPVKGGTKYRVNAYTAQGEIEAVMRVIESVVKTTDELRLPPMINKMATLKDGLILVAGSTGSGKSTTLAALIDYVNKRQEKRIITIENPVEVMHTDVKSVISQREVGGDTDSFAAALRSVLRQNPDIILIGEIRDKETADSALQAAQTGHLVFSTIHAGTAEETIKRFANLYPAEERAEVKKTLAYSLKGIIVQRLMNDLEDKKLPILEIMTSSDRLSQSLLTDAEGNEGENITKIISESDINGMITMDQYLINLVIANVIDVQMALTEAVNALTMRQNLHRRGLIK